jgi:hypothetical protein
LISLYATGLKSFGYWTSKSLEEARFARSISTEDVEILAPVTIVGLYLVMFMWYVEQERKTRAFAQGLSGVKRCRRTP